MKKNQIVGSVLLLAIVFSLNACRKNDRYAYPTNPNFVEMDYLNLFDKKIKRHEPAAVLDLNKDGQYDLIFSVQLVGDALNQADKTQFNVSSSFYTNLPINVNEQILPMTQAQKIPLNNFNEHYWYNVGQSTLVEKVEFVSGNIIWRGVWQEAIKKYLPFQVTQNGLRYNGWVELSVDIANQQLVLHRAAISKKAEQEVQAGL